MSRLLVAQRALTVPGWAKNVLWRNARAVPSLDLRFADNKSLVDAVTGASLITFTRASSGTYVDSAGVLQTAANDVPRFDHNPTTGESLGLLVEESRTNLLLRSEEFETTWTRTNISGFGSGSLVNAETAPNGTLTADLIAVANGINSGSGFISQDITKAATATTYTVTVFAKAQNLDAVTLHAQDVATNNNRATVTFSLATGVITTAATAFGTFSAASAITATPFINGWFRVNLTFTSSTETGLRVRLIPNNSTTVASDGTSGIYLWGAQLEAGAFPTSYIPTTTAAATRSADVASIGSSAFSGWYRQDEGTVFCDALGLGAGVPISDFQSLATFSDGTNATRIELGYLSASSAYWNLRSAGLSSVEISPTVSAARRLLAASYSSALAEISVNGAAALSDSSVTVPLVNKLDIGGANGAAIKEFNGHIRRLTFFPQRLPNSTLPALTQ